MSEETTKKYYGKREIIEVKGEDGKEEATLVLDDGAEVRLTGKAYLVAVTDSPLDADLTGVRDLVTREVVKDIIGTLKDYGVRMIDIQHDLDVLVTVLNEMERLGDNKAYGFDRKYDLTVRKLDEIINS